MFTYLLTLAAVWCKYRTEMLLRNLRRYASVRAQSQGHHKGVEGSNSRRSTAMRLNRQSDETQQLFQNPPTTSRRQTCHRQGGASTYGFYRTRRCHLGLLKRTELLCSANVNEYFSSSLLCFSTTTLPPPPPTALAPPPPPPFPFRPMNCLCLALSNFVYGSIFTTQGRHC